MQFIGSVGIQIAGWDLMVEGGYGLISLAIRLFNQPFGNCFVAPLEPWQHSRSAQHGVGVH